jgi:ribosomal protein S18 acetylase RimI-like enzyme
MATHTTGRGVRLAGEDDVPELVRLRALLFGDLAPHWGAVPPGDQWRDACAVALTTVLADGAMRVVVTDSDSGLACCGIGAVDRRLPSPFNPDGRIGHLFGIVTDPAHRGRGHARAVTQALLDWFDQQGLRRVDLNASPDGQRLYRSLGFADHPDPTLSRKRPGR